MRQRAEQKSKGKRAALILAVLLAVILLGLGAAAVKSPRLRLLLSTVYFSEKTLKDPGYIAYHIDLMDLCRNYLNGDTTVTGRGRLHSVKNLGFSSSMDLQGARSFDQKKLTLHADLDVLWLSVGEMDIYGQEDTLYLVVPMLDDLSEAFVTGQSLFQKAPDFTSDITPEWFRSHAKDIVTLMRQIQVEETGKLLEDDNGQKNKEYLVTIPKGCGEFIWELLGMEAPDYDVVLSVYLTPSCHLRRIEMDLSNIMEGASLVVDGEDAGTCIFTCELPEEEQMVMTFTRDASITHTNVVEVVARYATNQGKEYRADMYLTIAPGEDACRIKVSDMKLVAGEDETLAEGSFEGEIKKAEGLPDLFAGVQTDLDAVERIEWKELREDTEGFLLDLIEKAKEAM